MLENNFSVRNQGRAPRIAWCFQKEIRDMTRVTELLKWHTPECLVVTGHHESIPLSIPIVSQVTEANCDVLLVLDDAGSTRTMGKRIWQFIPGDPRADWGEGAIERAIDAGLPRVGITLAEVSCCPPKILAFDTTICRTWDSAAAVSARLELCLPSLLKVALERERAGASSLPVPTLPVIRPPAEHAGSSLKRMRDVKYFIHRLLAPLARGHGHWFMGAQPSRILLFHSPPPDILDEYLSALAQVAPFLSLEEVLACLAERRHPPRGFVVTFDDGYKQNLALLDVLDRHRCPAVFYVSTRPLGTRLPLWFMNHDKHYIQYKERLRGANYAEFLKLESDLGLDATDDLHWRFGLTAEELRNIKARGHQIGVHTVNHPFLPRLTDAEVKAEIGGAFDALKEVLGSKGLALDVSYPNGDYDERIVGLLREMGARSATTLELADVTASTDPLRLPRFCAGDDAYLGYAFFKHSALFRAIRGNR